MAENDNDIILQQKIRNPIPVNERGNWNWEWATPIQIHRDGSVYLNGTLNEFSVETDNLIDRAVTDEKIAYGSIKGAAGKDTSNENVQVESHIAEKTINGWNIADNAITTEKILDEAITLTKLSKDMKITSNYINITDIFGASTADPNNEVRAVTRETIRKGAITHSKLFNPMNIDQASNAEDGEVDNLPPVWGENIKDEAIEPRHIGNKTIPFSKLNYRLDQIDNTNNYILVFKSSSENESNNNS